MGPATGPICQPLRPDQQDSQKGLPTTVRVCHPRGCLRGCLLEGHSCGYRIKPIRPERVQIRDSPTKVRRTEIRLPEIRPPEVGRSKDRPSQLCPSEVRPLEIGPSEIRTLEVCSGEVHPAQVHPAQVRPTKVPATGNLVSIDLHGGHVTTRLPGPP